LTHFECSGNPLNTLDISNNVLLEVVYLNEIQLNYIDFSQNLAMKKIRITGNSLTAIDVSNNTLLEVLVVSYNSISSLDLSNNLNLEELACLYNSITTIDLSAHTSFRSISCKGNSLTSLDLANGNNTNIYYFEATNNPNLSCINVDNVAYSTTSWTNIDATASFSLNCSSTVGVNEQADNHSLSIYPNPAKNELIINNGELKIEQVLIFDMTGKTVKTIIGNVNTVNVSELTRGIYFIQIQTETGLVNNKFIKE